MVFYISLTDKRNCLVVMNSIYFNTLYEVNKFIESLQGIKNNYTFNIHNSFYSSINSDPVKESTSRI